MPELILLPKAFFTLFIRCFTTCNSATELGLFDAKKLVLFCGIFTKLEELVFTYIGRNMRFLSIQIICDKHFVCGLSTEIAFQSNVDLMRLSKRIRESGCTVLILASQ